MGRWTNAGGTNVTVVKRITCNLNHDHQDLRRLSVWPHRRASSNIATTRSPATEATYVEGGTDVERLVKCHAELLCEGLLGAGYPSRAVNRTVIRGRGPLWGGFPLMAQPVDGPVISWKTP